MQFQGKDPAQNINSGQVIFKLNKFSKKFDTRLHEFIRKSQNRTKDLFDNHKQQESTYK